MGLLLCGGAQLYARETLSALDDSTDRVTYVYDGPEVSFGQVAGFALLEVPDFFEINDVDVTITIMHTWLADVTVTIESPEGEEITLFPNLGGPDDNLVDTEFNDAASLSINQGQAPFTGSFRPAEPLSAFNEGGGTGTWTLRMLDNFPSLDDGVLQSFELTLGGRIGGVAQGRVTSAQTGAAVRGVRVETVGASYETFSDSAGWYQLLVQEGTYDLAFTFPGWCPVEFDQVELMNFDTVTLNVPIPNNLYLPASSINVYLPEDSATEIAIPFRNDGECTLTWTVQIFDDWLQVGEMAGAMPYGDSTTLVLTIGDTALEVGDYTTRIVIDNNSPDSLIVIPVFLSVTDWSDAASAEVAQEFEVSPAYPNPFNAQARVTLSLPRSTEVRAELFDVLGRTAMIVYDGVLGAGEQTIMVNGNALASGAYFLSVRAFERREIVKLVLQK
jgi:subtilisin-like proprotein convertase family protein